MAKPMIAEENTHCPHCGASLKMYWHRLTPILVKALIKFRLGVLTKGENKIHLIRDLTGSNELAPYEWKNWTKVRFHGLVAKYKKDGVWVRGYWVLTKRGNDFLHGRVSIPDSVLTFHNKIKERSTNLVTVHDVMHRLDLPEMESLDDIQWQLAEPDVEDSPQMKQAELF